jgi:hypothetical protein
MIKILTIALVCTICSCAPKYTLCALKYPHDGDRTTIEYVNYPVSIKEIKYLDSLSNRYYFLMDSVGNEKQKLIERLEKGIRKYE